jgi:protein-disulfide isomerase
VEFVVRDWPLPATMHPNAQKASEATECAHDQGEFWEYHDALYANQSALDVASLKSYAAQLGLDTATFDECLDGGEKVAEVAKDKQDGTSYGVGGTPAFFINGRFVSGAIPFEDYPDRSGVMQPGFKTIIDEAVAAAEAGAAVPTVARSSGG